MLKQHVEASCWKQQKSSEFLSYRQCLIFGDKIEWLSNKYIAVDFQMLQVEDKGNKLSVA